jgi:hypothetical protein
MDGGSPWSSFHRRIAARISSAVNLARRRRGRLGQSWRPRSGALAADHPHVLHITVSDRAGGALD